MSSSTPNRRPSRTLEVVDAALGYSPIPNAGSQSPYAKVSKSQQDAFRQHQPHTYVHTNSVEAVLAPIAEQLSNLIVIMADAARESAAIPDLTAAAEAIVKAGANLVNVGHDAMAEGDDELKSTMPVACDKLNASAKLFRKATDMLVADPFKAEGRDILVQGVRGLLAATTDILVSYDGFDVRQMVRVANSLLEHLKIARQAPKMKNRELVLQMAQRIKTESPHLESVCQERATELCNATHSSRLRKASRRLKTTTPLVAVSMRTVSRHAVSEQAQKSFLYAVHEMDSALHEIIVVLQLTNLDDHTYNAKSGALAVQMEDARSQLLQAPGEVQFERLERGVMKAVSTSAAAVKKMHDDTRIERLRTDDDATSTASDASAARGTVDLLQVVKRKVRSGELSDEEVSTILDKHEAATKDDDDGADVSSGIGDGTDDARPRRSSARVAALRTEMTALLHELRHNPSETRMDDVNECLEELDSTVKVAAVEELTEAMLSDEFPADRLAEVADTQDDVAFQEQVVQFQRQTKRITSAAQMVSASSRDARRVSIVEETAGHLLGVSEQMVNAAILTKEDPCDTDAREQRNLMKQTYNEDLDTLKKTIHEMVDTALVLTADYDFCRGIAAAAIVAARTGYPAAARAAVRKLRKRIGHVITVAASEMENSEDADFCRAIDEKLMLVEDVDPQVAAVMEDLTANPEDEQILDKFEAVMNRVIEVVRDLRACIVPLDTSRTVSRSSATDDVPEDDVLEEGVFAMTHAVHPMGSAMSVQGSTADVHTAAATSNAVQSPPTTSLHHLAVPPPAGGTAMDDSMMFAMMSSEESEAPVIKAAVKLRREANKWSEVKNPVVGSAKRLATSMARMAQIQGRTQGDMGDMITTSKGIVEEGKDLITHAKAIAQRCSDKRMKSDLKALCARIQTIGVQLKISASVKATCGDDDVQQADAMLVNTAQNLMDASQHLVRACESASLKLLPKKEGDVDSTDDILWRKRVRHGGATAAWYQRQQDSTDDADKYDC